MSMTTCKECGADVSNKAIMCPACGYSRDSKTQTYLGFILILMMLSMFARCAAAVMSLPQ